MKRSIQSVALAVAVLLLAGTVQAAPVTVNNFSFEEQQLDAGGWTNVTPPGWQEPVADGGDSFTEEISGFVAEGQNHEGLQNASFIWQDLGIPVQPLTNYTLTVAVGNRNANFSPPGNISRFQLTAGAPDGPVIATADVDASTLGTSTFVDFQAIGATGATAPTGNLMIRLATAGAGRAHYDNIRLDATVIPEPSLVGAAGLATFGLMLRRRRA